MHHRQLHRGWTVFNTRLICMHPAVKLAYGTTAKSIAIWYATAAIDASARQVSSGIHRSELVRRKLAPLSAFFLQPANAVLFVLVNNNFSAQWNTTGITVAANQLNMPVSVSVDVSNTLHISDFGNNQVQQKWLPAASIGTIVAGRSDSLAGSGLSELSSPFGIFGDSSGGVYVTDAWNDRIVLWRNESSVGTIVEGTGKKTRENCVVQHMYRS